MPWSIFTDGGGDGAAFTWARDLLAKIGAPETAGNEQVVFDWEKSEGGGGKFNPLNQGPVPGDPALTTTGTQFGGGAADFASWDAGIQGAADYLGMANFQPIEQALLAGNAQGARSAIINSPWAASHYGGGSAFSGDPLPGRATALAPGGGSAGGSSPGAAGSGGLLGSVTAPLTALSSAVSSGIILVPVVLGAAALGAYGLVRATGAGTRARQAATAAAATGAL